MSTQINATQHNFTNQVTEFSTPAINKNQPSSDGKLHKVTNDSKPESSKANQFKEQQAITNDLRSSEALLSKQEEILNKRGEALSEEKPLVLDEALELISDFMQLSSRNVNFQQDEVSDKTVIKFFDTESKELIKQFPSEEVLEIAQKIVSLRQDVGEKTGIFLEEKV
jgi:flagellar protein FlaG